MGCCLGRGAFGQDGLADQERGLGIYTHDEAQRSAAPRRAAEASRDAYEKALAARGFGRITTEIAPAGELHYAEDYHQQYLEKNPDGYCGLGGTGVSCPIGLGGASR